MHVSGNVKTKQVPVERAVYRSICLQYLLSFDLPLQINCKSDLSNLVVILYLYIDNLCCYIARSGRHLNKSKKSSSLFLVISFSVIRSIKRMYGLIYLVKLKNYLYKQY